MRHLLLAASLFPTLAAAQKAPAASCTETLACYGQCKPMTQACMAGCDQRTAPAAAQGAHALLQCMAQSGCPDPGCVAQRCGAQLAACTGPAPAAPPAAAGPDAVMQPEYNVVGALVIPPPRRVLQQSDLAGEWHRNDGAAAAYATANGNYAGFDAVSIAQGWVVDAQGNLVENFKAAYSGFSAGRPAVQEKNRGTLRADGHNILRLDRPAQNGNKASTEFYVVLGWFVGPQVILMKLNGPYYGSISAKEIADAPSNGWNNAVYMKKR